MPEDSSVKRTPLFDQHVAAGARMVEFAGWEMPVQYTGVLEEHRAVRSAAGLFDVSHMGEILVTGAGAEELVQRLTPNDLTKLSPGRAHYSGLLTEEGTYIDDLLVYRLGDEEILLVVNAANDTSDLEWVKSHAGSDVTVASASERYALLALQGPRAQEILQPLTELALDELRYYRFATDIVGGHEALISRTGYTGEDGFELYVPPQAAAELWRTILAAGDGAGLVPAGLAARDTLRLEAGMALYGHEIDLTTTPFDAGLNWVVKLEQADFIGRQALLRQKEKGPSRRLVGFEVTSRGIARQGHAIVHGGSEVGEVTSGTFSPTFEKAIGMGYVPVELAEPGQALTIRVKKRELDAVVVSLPFYKRA